VATDERVLVLMPTARDGERTRRILAGAGLACTVCKDVKELCREIAAGAGLALLTEEMVVADRDGSIQSTLGKQPPWSDFPLVVLARQGQGTRLLESVNATLVERPVKFRSLMSVVRAALRSRRHQYAIRNHLLERKQAEEDQARLAAIVASSDDAIISKSLDGIIQSWNAGAQHLFGYTPEEAIGQSIILIIPPERQAEEQLILERLRRGERLEHFETVRLARDGRRMDISLTISPIRNARGQVVGASKVARDITEKKLAERELREADRKKDDFIALLAHELRNPLAPLKNCLQVMRLAARDPNKLEQARATMDRQLTHMVRLIDDLLDVSRISRNKMELRRQRILLSDVVSSAVETARPLIDAANQDLTITLPAMPVFLDADLTRLAQVFSNLLTNSAKYTARGGKIRLTASVKDEGGSSASPASCILHPASFVEVSVQDNGIGIPAEALPRIFDMFSQVDRTVERSTGGLGIGLALVKGLVEMHGGRVSAESPGEGLGSTFTIWLPAFEGMPASQESGALENGHHVQGRKVLVVDDNRDGAASMALMLQLMGDEVCIAHDGIEAIKVAGQFRPQVILMDVGMPRLNGLDATRRIREKDWGKEIKIIALTGWGQENDRAQSRKAGCDGHLVKPVSLQDLEQMLEEVHSMECGGVHS
jgi:PAS domain S-box-containing protein